MGLKSCPDHKIQQLYDGACFFILTSHLLRLASFELFVVKKICVICGHKSF